MLEMFTTEFDYVIAESEQEARKFCADYYGDEEALDEMEFEVMDMEADFTFAPDPDDRSTKETKKVRQWIEERGAGYFACTEF